MTSFQHCEINVRKDANATPYILALIAENIEKSDASLTPPANAGAISPVREAVNDSQVVRVHCATGSALVRRLHAVRALLRRILALAAAPVVVRADEVVAGRRLVALREAPGLGQAAGARYARLRAGEELVASNAVVIAAVPRSKAMRDALPFSSLCCAPRLINTHDFLYQRLQVGLVSRHVDGLAQVALVRGALRAEVAAERWPNRF